MVEHLEKSSTLIVEEVCRWRDLLWDDYLDYKYKKEHTSEVHNPEGKPPSNNYLQKQKRRFWVNSVPYASFTVCIIVQGLLYCQYLLGLRNYQDPL